jgi:hypothetical protein
MKYAYWYRKYIDARGFQNCIIKADKILQEHSSSPLKFNPYDIIDHVQETNRKIDKRIFYNGR